MARIRVRRAQADTVERDVVERRIDAADVDITSFALIVAEVDAGQTLDILRRVLVGQLTDFVRGDDILDALRRALLVNRAKLRQTLTAHDDRFERFAAAGCRAIDGGGFVAQGDGVSVVHGDHKIGAVDDVGQRICPGVIPLQRCALVTGGCIVGKQQLHVGLPRKLIERSGCVLRRNVERQMSSGATLPHRLCCQRRGCQENTHRGLIVETEKHFSPRCCQHCRPVTATTTRRTTRRKPPSRENETIVQEL
jgi:hypothetical protein